MAHAITVRHQREPDSIADDHVEHGADRPMHLSTPPRVRHLPPHLAELFVERAVAEAGHVDAGLKAGSFDGNRGGNALGDRCDIHGRRELHGIDRAGLVQARERSFPGLGMMLVCFGRSLALVIPALEQLGPALAQRALSRSDVRVLAGASTLLVRDARGDCLLGLAGLPLGRGLGRPAHL